MEVTLKRHKNSDYGWCEVRRADGPKIYSESRLLHLIKRELIKQGYDVIKKRMWKDGHMYGDETTQYIRTRSRKMDRDSFHIYDGGYALRLLYEPYNKGGFVELGVGYDIFRNP